jgi:hypothetical protein
VHLAPNTGGQQRPAGNSYVCGKKHAEAFRSGLFSANLKWYEVEQFGQPGVLIIAVDTHSSDGGFQTGFSGRNFRKATRYHFPLVLAINIWPFQVDSDDEFRREGCYELCNEPEEGSPEHEAYLECLRAAAKMIKSVVGLRTMHGRQTLIVGLSPLVGRILDRMHQLDAVEPPLVGVGGYPIERLHLPVHPREAGNDHGEIWEGLLHGGRRVLLAALRLEFRQAADLHRQPHPTDAVVEAAVTAMFPAEAAREIHDSPPAPESQTPSRKCGRPGCTVTELQMKARMQKCDRCKAVRYCGRSCQVADWPVHKSHCKPKPEIKNK